MPGVKLRKARCEEGLWPEERLERRDGGAQRGDLGLGVRPRPLQTEDHVVDLEKASVVEPNALEMLPQLIWHYDEPFGDSSAIPTMYLSEMTRQHVTVSLTGDAGDELFCGYDRYRAVRIAGMLSLTPRWIRRAIAATVGNQMPASVQQKSFRCRRHCF